MFQETSTVFTRPTYSHFTSPVGIPFTPPPQPIICPFTSTHLKLLPCINCRNVLYYFHGESLLFFWFPSVDDLYQSCQATHPILDNNHWNNQLMVFINTLLNGMYTPMLSKMKFVCLSVGVFYLWVCLFVFVCLFVCLLITSLIPSGLPWFIVHYWRSTFQDNTKTLLRYLFVGVFVCLFVCFNQ